jgi:oxygen-independent coproporphyrinogen-3 oxidase
MYEYADELLLKHNYMNYEISNWAQPGHASRHNLTYWQNLPYLGMGAGAYSSFGGRRFSDERDPQKYVRLLKAGQRPEAESETVDREQEMSETAFLALRTAMGLHLPTFEQRFGLPFTQFVGDRLDLVEEAGLLEHDGQAGSEEWLCLSKRGRLLGNEVFMRLLPD